MIEFNKLVRDKIPDIIENNGEIELIAVNDEERFKNALKPVKANITKAKGRE